MLLRAFRHERPADASQPAARREPHLEEMKRFGRLASTQLTLEYVRFPDRQPGIRR